MQTPEKLKPFIAELRKVDIKNQSESQIVSQIKPIVKEWVSRKDWLIDEYNDPGNGENARMIHCNDDDSLMVLIDTWDHSQPELIHNHNTWAVVGIVKGVEKNSMWRCVEGGEQPGPAKLEKISDKLCGEGEVFSMTSQAWHSVTNQTPDRDVAISLHIYGKNLETTNRFKYDSETQKCDYFVMDFA